MKKIKSLLTDLGVVLICIFVIVAGLYVYNLIFFNGFLQGQSGGKQLTSYQIMFGSADNLVSVPNVATWADSTTTDAGASVLDGGFTINQFFDKSGVNDISLAISAVGGTATSTCFIVPMVSGNGTDYFFVTTSTNQLEAATTTAGSQYYALEFDPGTVTTTYPTIDMPLPTAKFVRFITYGENKDNADDAEDGCQMYLTLNYSEGF